MSEDKKLDLENASSEEIQEEFPDGEMGASFEDTMNTSLEVSFTDLVRKGYNAEVFAYAANQMVGEDWRETGEELLEEDDDIATFKEYVNQTEDEDDADEETA